MNTIKRVIAFVQLSLSLGVIFVLASNEALLLITSQYEIALVTLLIFWMSIGLFVLLTTKEKIEVGLPEYRNPPMPPERDEKRVINAPMHAPLEEENNILPLFHSVKIAEAYAISELKEEKLKKTKYIYMCSGGKVIVLDHQIGGVKPIVIVKPE